RHKSCKGQVWVNVLLDGVNKALVIDTGDKAAEHGRGDVVGVAFNGGGQGQHLALGQRAAKQRVRTKQTGHDAGRGRTKAPGHRDIVALGDPQAFERNTELVIHRAGAAEHKVVRPAGDMGAIQGGDFDAAGFLKSKDVVHRKGKAERVKPRADIGAGGRNGD